MKVGLGYRSPRASVDDVVDVARSHAEELSNIGLPTTSSSKKANLGHIIFRELAGPTVSMTAFPNSVSGVVFGSSEEQMVWVHARRVVTPMTDEDLWWQRFSSDHLHDEPGSALPATTYRQPTVPGWESVPQPRPTCERPSGAVGIHDKALADAKALVLQSSPRTSGIPVPRPSAVVSSAPSSRVCSSGTGVEGAYRGLHVLNSSSDEWVV